MLIKKPIFLLIIFLPLFLLILLTYRHYGITWDENAYVESGRYYGVKILQTLGFASAIPLPKYHQIEPHFATHGVTTDVIIAGATKLLSTVLDERPFITLHLTKALLAIPTFLILGLLVRKILNAPLTIVSMICLLLTPRFYGDIFTNSVDIPTAFFFSLSLYATIIFIKSKKTTKHILLLGLTTGLLISQRPPLIYMLIIQLLIISVTKSNRVKIMATITTTALITLFLTHPYFFRNPLSGFGEIVTSSTLFPFTQSILFMGKFYQPTSLPWYYLPISIVITTPLLTLLLFTIGNISIITAIFRGKKTRQEKVISGFILLSFWTPILITVLSKPVLYDSWRHFLFLMIPMIVIAMYGLKTMWHWVGDTAKILVVIFIIFNLLLTTREMILLHPYQYTYYNSLVGGLKGAYGKFETDYWGAGYKEAVEWFNENINNPKKTYYIKTEGNSLSSTFFFKKNMIWTQDIKKADYLISYTRWNKYKQGKGKIIHTVERRGIPLIFIKKLARH